MIEFLKMAISTIFLFLIFCVMTYVFTRLITWGILKTIEQYHERGKGNEEQGE
jgi:hypothetical protein